MWIAEIGPNSYSVYNLSGTVAKQLQDGANYIGIDLTKNRLRYITNNARCHAVCGDLEDLPLTDRSIDEVWVVNVFSEGIADLFGFQRSRSYFEELYRILKPHGKIQIAEYYGRFGNIDWLITSDYTNLGFSKQVFSDASLQSFVNRYDWRRGCFEPGVQPFFVTLTKV